MAARWEESPELSAELAGAVGDWRRPSAEPSPSTKPPARPKDPAACTASGPPGRAVGAVPSKPTPVLDLIHNTPGVSLQAQIDAAQAAGQRATILRSIFLGKHARSPWERGAIGERLVAAELERLQKADPRWRFLHSIPVGTKDSDIDHLLIGPAGVFTINSKNHAGMKVWVGGNTFMVNGVRQPYIRNSRHPQHTVEKVFELARRSTTWLG